MSGLKGPTLCIGGPIDGQLTSYAGGTVTVPARETYRVPTEPPGELELEPSRSTAYRYTTICGEGVYVADGEDPVTATRRLVKAYATAARLRYLVRDLVSATSDELPEALAARVVEAVREIGG